MTRPSYPVPKQLEAAEAATTVGTAYVQKSLKIVASTSIRKYTYLTHFTPAALRHELSRFLLGRGLATSLLVRQGSFSPMMYSSNVSQLPARVACPEQVQYAVHTWLIGSYKMYVVGIYTTFK